MSPVVYLRPPGVFVPRGLLTPRQISDLSTRYQTKTWMISGKWDVRSALQRLSDGTIVLPRDVAQDPDGFHREFSLRIVRDYPVVETYPVEVFTGGNLRLNPMQMVVADQAVRFSTRGCTITLKPGQGKSFVAAGVIERVAQRTLIIVPFLPLLRQWMDLLPGWFPHAQIGCISGEKTSSEDTAHVVCVTVHSIAKLTRVYLDTFGLCIVDETHEFTSEKRVECLRRVSMARCVGLTGTPWDSPRGLDAHAHWAIGRLLPPPAADPTIPTVQLRGNVLRVMYTSEDPEYATVQYTECAGQTIPAYTANLQTVCADPARRSMCVGHVRRLAEQLQRAVFVFADRVEYLVQLHAEFVSAAPATCIARVISGGSTVTRFDEAVADASVIFTTYQYLGTARSVPRMNAIVFATPRKSHVAQYVGRIFRGETDPGVIREIVDVVDVQFFAKQYTVRAKVYAEADMTVETVVTRGKKLAPGV